MELNTILKKMAATFAFNLFLGFIIKFINPKLEKPATAEKLANQKEALLELEHCCFNKTKLEQQASLKRKNHDKYKSYEKE